MEFQKERVFTALNADELKPGSKVIAANNIDSLKCKVYDGDDIIEVKKILDESYELRFQLDCKGAYPFVYLISEPEEKKLKWTDLKIGDIIQNECTTLCYMVVGIDMREESKTHIYNGVCWLDNDDLNYWKKVETE